MVRKNIGDIGYSEFAQKTDIFSRRIGGTRCDPGFRDLFFDCFSCLVQLRLQLLIQMTHAQKNQLMKEY